MRVLVISGFFPPEVTAAAFRLGDLVERMSEEDHDVVVIAPSPSKQVLGSSPTGARVVRVRSLRERGTKLSYAASYASFAVGASLALLFQRPRKFDVVVASSPPLTVAVPALLMRHVFGRPLLTDVRDLWPDSAVAMGLLSSDGAATRALAWLESRLYSASDALVAVSAPMATEVARRSGKNVGIAYNGCENHPTTGQPADHTVRTLTYAGNLGKAQDLSTLLHGFAMSGLENWRLQIVGSGTERESLQLLAERLDVAVDFRGPVSQAEARQILADSDALYLGLKADPTFEMTIPSKLFEYLGAGRPIIGAIAGEGREILGVTGANDAVVPGDHDDLGRALQDLDTSLAERAAMAGRNTKVAEERFSRSATYRSFMEAISRIRVSR